MRVKETWMMWTSSLPIITGRAIVFTAYITFKTLRVAHQLQPKYNHYQYDELLLRHYQFPH